MEMTSLDQCAHQQHPPLYINPRTGGPARIPQLVWLPPGYTLTKIVPDNARCDSHPCANFSLTEPTFSASSDRNILIKGTSAQGCGVRYIEGMKEEYQPMVKNMAFPSFREATTPKTAQKSMLEKLLQVPTEATYDFTMSDSIFTTQQNQQDFKLESHLSSPSTVSSSSSLSQVASSLSSLSSSSALTPPAPTNLLRMALVDDTHPMMINESNGKDFMLMANPAMATSPSCFPVMSGNSSSEFSNRQSRFSKPIKSKCGKHSSKKQRVRSVPSDNCVACPYMATPIYEKKNRGSRQREMFPDNAEERYHSSDAQNESRNLQYVFRNGTNGEKGGQNDVEAKCASTQAAEIFSAQPLKKSRSIETFNVLVPVKTGSNCASSDIPATAFLSSTIQIPSSSEVVSTRTGIMNSYMQPIRTLPEAQPSCVKGKNRIISWLTSQTKKYGEATTAGRAVSSSAESSASLAHSVAPPKCEVSSYAKLLAAISMSSGASSSSSNTKSSSIVPRRLHRIASAESLKKLDIANAMLMPKILGKCESNFCTAVPENNVHSDSTNSACVCASTNSGTNVASSTTDSFISDCQTHSLSSPLKKDITSSESTPIRHLITDAPSTPLPYSGVLRGPFKRRRKSRKSLHGLVPGNYYFHPKKAEWRARYLENGVKRMKTFSARRHGMETGRQLAEVFLMEMQRTSRIPNDATCFKLVAEWVASCSTAASSTTSSPISPAKSVESAAQSETPSGSAEQKPCEPIQYPSSTLSENQLQSSSLSSLVNNSVQSRPLYHLSVQPEDFLLPSTTHSRLAAGSRKYLTLNHPQEHETVENYSTLTGEDEESGKRTISVGDVMSSMKSSGPALFRPRKIRKKRVRTEVGQKNMLKFDLNRREAFNPNVSGDDYEKEGRICTPVEMGGAVPEYQDEVTSRRYTEVVTRRGRKCRQLVGFASKTKNNIDVFNTGLLKDSRGWVTENCNEQSPPQEANADVCSSTGSTVTSVVQVAPGVVYDLMEDLEDRPFPEGVVNVLAFGESSEDDGDEKCKMRIKPRIVKLTAPDNMWLPHFHPHNQQFGLEGAKTFAMALVDRWIDSGRPLAQKTKRSKLSVLDINTSCQIISTPPRRSNSASSLPMYIERAEGNSPPQRRRHKHKPSLVISIQKRKGNSPPQRRIRKAQGNSRPQRRFNSQMSLPIFLQKAESNSSPQPRLDSKSSLPIFIQKAESKSSPKRRLNSKSSLSSFLEKEDNSSPQKNPQILPVGLDQIRSSPSGKLSGKEDNHRGSVLSSSSFLPVSLPCPNSFFSQSASSYFSSFASNILEADAAEKLAQSKVPDRCAEESVKNILSASASFSSPFTCSGESNSGSCEPKGDDGCCDDGDCTTLNRVRGTRGVNCETNDELGFLLL